MHQNSVLHAVPPPADGAPRAVAVSTSHPIDALFENMIAMGASDLHLSVGSPPLVRKDGHMQPLGEAHGVLSSDDIVNLLRPILPESNRKEFGDRHDTDFAYELKGAARFRGNVFLDRRGPGAVFRVIPAKILTAEQLGLSQHILDLCKLTKGLVLVTGPTGSGKSTTLCAMVDYINRTRNDHIITIEDPIEFLHNHKCSTIHQRELHSDTPSFAHALRSAMRQAPKVILVGEMRDRETIEIVLEAAETGHLVFSSLNTMDASKTVERIVSSFSPSEQQSVRERFAKSFRYIICQRLMSKEDRSGRVAAFEILKANARTRECIEKGERENKSLLDAIRAGTSEGMRHFDEEIAQLVRDHVIDLETGLSFASNPAGLGQELAR